MTQTNYLVLPNHFAPTWPKKTEEILSWVSVFAENCLPMGFVNIVISNPVFIENFLKYYQVTDPAEFSDPNIGIRIVNCEMLLGRCMRIHISVNVSGFDNMEEFIETLHGIYPFENSTDLRVSTVIGM